FPVFQKTRAVVFAHKLDECRRVRLPVRREPFEILENCAQTSGAKERHGVLGIFVKVGVKDALVHEVGLAFDREEYPTQVVQLEYGKAVRLLSNGLLDVARILVEDLLAAWDDLR